ncbi:hypothetical protein E1B28_003994 [Marasmius oreades]|uniref:Uncharacterized protein n=1 Tax=Marasmius oreades TaxID=181124 RepID=A0A9P7UXN8_9AGAR|nr:uncharacterized protein E1B28_003994 [Marasmius oreades]KAG7096574.1 hypothetical protein E1B28_003994 [Marasmius oreades]
MVFCTEKSTIQKSLYFWPPATASLAELHGALVASATTTGTDAIYDHHLISLLWLKIKRHILSTQAYDYAGTGSILPAESKRTCTTVGDLGGGWSSTHCFCERKRTLITEIGQ